jgi:hypothetical protein
VPVDDIEAITVTETVKEGVTIFALTPDEIIKGELMLPGGDAATPLQDFLNVASVYRDFGPADRPMRPGMASVIRQMANAPHDRGCVTRLLDDIIAQAVL